MPRVLIADRLDEPGLAILRRAGCEVVQLAAAERSRIAERLADCDALIVRTATRVSRPLLAAAGPRLRVIGRAGTGLDSIDCEAAQERGIALVHAPDANTVATAEHTFALLLALARRVPQADSSLKAGRWDRESLVGFELGGKRLGIVGFGRIGRAVAERARAFAMAVAACDPAVPAAAMAERGVEAMALDRLLPHSEILTLHLPLTPASQGLLSLERLRQLPAGAILVNCARGGLVDEESLLELLDGGHLAGAALDVFEGEPRPWEALLRHPRVLATPHLGSRTHEAQRRVSEEVATAVVRALGLASGEAG